MSPTDSVHTAREVFGPRFLLTGFLPAVTAGGFLLLLAWAGDGASLRFDDAWRTAATLGVGQVVLGVLVLTVVAVVLHPLQLPMIRLLEGYWPGWAEPAGRLGRQRETRRRDRLAKAAEVPDTEDPAAVQRAGQAGAALRAAFPLTPGTLLPTALGNALAAAESRAGREYGFDAVVAWPRLYPVLGETTRALVDARRNTLDGLARMSVTMLATAVLAVPLLAGRGWWLALAVVPLLVARVAYLGAVRAAVAFGEALRTAFDLHRFDLLRRLHLPLPADQDTERKANGELCTMWRQAPADPTLGLTYTHDDPEPA